MQKIYDWIDLECRKNGNNIIREQDNYTSGLLELEGLWRGGEEIEEIRVMFRRVNEKGPLR